MKRASTFGVLLVSALTAYPHPARLGARNLIDADACGALFKLPLADYSQKGFVATYINSEAGNQIGGLTYWATLDLPRAGKSEMHVATRNRNGLKDAQAIFESITFSKEHSNRGQKTRIKLRRQLNEISRDTADLQKGDGND